MGLEERARAAAVTQQEAERRQAQSASEENRPVRVDAHPDLAELHQMLLRTAPRSPLHVPRARTGRAQGYEWLADGWLIKVDDGDVDSTPQQKAAITTTGDVFTNWTVRSVHDKAVKKVSGRLKPRPPRRIHGITSEDIDVVGTRLTAYQVANRHWRAFIVPLAVDLVRKGAALELWNGTIRVTVPVGTD